MPRWSAESWCRTDLFVVSRQAVYDGWINTGKRFSWHILLCFADQAILTKGDAIDCATTQNCNEYHTQLNQSCTTDTTTWDNIFGAQIQAQFSLWFGKDNSISPTLSYDHSFGGSKAVQICTTTGDTGYALSLFPQIYTYVSGRCPTMLVAQPYHLFTYRIDRTCTWDDKNCHALWVAQRNLQVNGYLRRSCNTPRSGKFSRNHARLKPKN